MTSYANWSARERGRDLADPSEALSGGSARERRNAALVLVDRAADGRLDDRTVERLCRAARSDDDADVRQFAVEALGNAGEGGDAVAAALDDPDSWVRAEAVVALSRIRGEDAAPALVGALEDDDGWVRRNAVVALGKTGGVDAERLRDRLKDDPHPPVREYAAEYLGEFDDPETVRVLAAVLAREQNGFVRARAATALGRIGSDRAIEALERQGLTDRSDDVQRASERALAVARGEDPDRAVEDRPPSPGTGPDVPGGGGGPPVDPPAGAGGRVPAREPSGPPGDPPEERPDPPTDDGDDGGDPR